MLAGTYTAIVTPFRNGTFDAPAFRRLIDMQVKGGVDGIVPVGTTGESPTLDYKEHGEVIKHAVEYAAGRIKVMAGTGGNSTNEAVFLTMEAERAGADSTLQVAPYYNKPTQEGMFQHFLEISRATKLPLILYSIPSRCGVEIGIDTVRRLAGATPRLAGIKEAGGNADRVSQLREALGPKFSIFSGDDALTLPFMSLGAQGVISVASNIVPRQISRMVSAYRAGNASAALKIHQQLYPLFKDLFIETNPQPIKAALAMMGLIQEEFRLPLVPMSAKNRGVLKSTLIQCGVIRHD
ncbi:MAG TPA: 4-hydroxy-tetrahydrodipicolinate synthase [Verrucomicrobiae bacterium]|jgi:4-hydroxy-tetrahydrodipicolinate synthase|nr:4-hydroxy-tetrahydrodipicolinate synthase [Verrucomicrobiae bacterium]